MKRIIFAAAVVASSNVALAAQPVAVPPYSVTVSAGSAKQELSNDTGSISKSDTAFQISGAYRIAPNLDVEVGYTNFGKAEAPILGGGMASSKPQAAHVAISGAWRLTREFSVTGKLGVAHVSTKVDLGGFSDTESKNTLLAGVGVRYAVSPTVALVADFQHFGKIYSEGGTDLKARVLSAGVRFSF